MAVGGTPKTAGRKYSTRKILNGKRPSATLLADLLEDCNDQLEQVSSQNDVPQCKYLQLIPLIMLLIIQQNYQQPQVQINSFSLKWIAGTTASKCYGCRKK